MLCTCLGSMGAILIGSPSRTSSLLPPVRATTRRGGPSHAASPLNSATSFSSRSKLTQQRVPKLSRSSVGVSEGGELQASHSRLLEDLQALLHGRGPGIGIQTAPVVLTPIRIDQNSRRTRSALSGIAAQYKGARPRDLQLHLDCAPHRQQFLDPDRLKSGFDLDPEGPGCLLQGRR